MKKLIHKLVACVAASALAFGLVPASALAVSSEDLVSVGSAKEYTSEPGVLTQNMETEVRVIVVDDSGNIPGEDPDPDAGYTYGPFYDDGRLAGDQGDFWAGGQDWTWAIAGAGIDQLTSGGQDLLIANTANGQIHKAIKLESDTTIANTSKQAFLDAIVSTDKNLAYSAENAWNLAIRDGESDADAYKDTILVALKLNTDALPENAQFGTDFELYRIDPNDPTKAIPLSSSAGYKASYDSVTGLVTFYVSDSQATGALGTYALAIKQSQTPEGPTDPEVNLDFEFVAQVNDASMGTVSPASGAAPYGSEPTVIFTPNNNDSTEGFKVSKVEMTIYENKGAAVPKVETFEIKHGAATEGDTYGAWEGNSYTFPKDFNSDGNHGYAVILVTFEKIQKNDDDPSTTPEEQWPKLTVSVTAGQGGGAGKVYVVEHEEAASVSQGSKTFVTGKPLYTGSQTILAKNEIAHLMIEPAEGSRIGTVTVNGEVWQDVSQNLYTPLLANDVTVEVEFVYGIQDDTSVTYTVSTDYDSSQARVGFGTTEAGAEWISSKTVSAGDSTTLQIKPNVGYALQSVQLFYGSEPGPNVADQVQNGMLTIYDIQRDTRVVLTFAELSAQITIQDAPFGGTVTPKGTHTVKPSDLLEVVITADAGYELDMDSLLVRGTGADGQTVSNPPSRGVRVVHNPDGTTTYYIELTYEDAERAGEDATLGYAFKKAAEEGQTQYYIYGTAGDNGQIAAKTPVIEGADTKVFFFPDAGYRVAHIVVDGAQVTPPNAKTGTNDAIEWDITCSAPYIVFHSANESYRVHVVFEKIQNENGDSNYEGAENPGAEEPGDVVVTHPQQPGNAEGENKPGGSLLPDASNTGGGIPNYTGPDGGGTTFEAVPDDPEDDGTEWVIDGVEVGGVDILDEWGVELKDKMEGPDEDGFYTDPDSGVRWKDGIYYFPNSEDPDGPDSQVKFDPDTGTIEFVEVYEDLKPGASFASATRLTVTVVAKANAISNGGSITPVGENFLWKKKLPLTVIMLPDEDKELKNLTVNNNPLAHTEAAEGHLDDLYSALTLIERLHAQYNAQMSKNSRSLNADSQLVALTQGIQNVTDTVAIDRVVGALTGAERAYAAERLGLVSGMRAATIPGSYFQTEKNHIVIQADFGNETYTVTARVEGGHGTISGTNSTDETLTVSDIEKGAPYTVNYKADEGYVVKSVTDNGKAVTNFTKTSYAISDIQENHNIVVTFQAQSSTGAAGPNNAAAQALRRLQSLASTGDLMLPGLVLMIGIACGAAGVAVLASNRRRREEVGVEE